MEQDLLEIWYKRAEACHKSHYLASQRYSKYNLLLGIPTILFTTIVGTSVFASLSSAASQPTFYVVLIGLISIMAAISSSLQTFLGFNERSEKHREAGAKYGMVGRKMELLLSERTLPSGPDSIQLKKELDDLAVSSLRIPVDILKNAKLLIDDDSLSYTRNG